MKSCSFCAEQIQDAAIKCRFCGSALNPAPVIPVAPVLCPCPICAESIPVGTRACNICGSNFGEALSIGKARRPTRNNIVILAGGVSALAVVGALVAAIVLGYGAWRANEHRLALIAGDAAEAQQKSRIEQETRAQEESDRTQSLNIRREADSLTAENARNAATLAAQQRASQAEPASMIAEASSMSLCWEGEDECTRVECTVWNAGGAGGTAKVTLAMVDGEGDPYSKDVRGFVAAGSRKTFRWDFEGVSSEDASAICAAE